MTHYEVSWSALWVEKEFPDTRQKQREIELVRAGDSVRTDDWLKGEPTTNMGHPPVFIARKKGMR